MKIKIKSIGSSLMLFCNVSIGSRYFVKGEEFVKIGCTSNHGEIKNCVDLSTGVLGYTEEHDHVPLTPDQHLKNRVVSFGELDAGDVFMYAESVFVKCNTVSEFHAFHNGAAYNSFNLQRSYLCVVGNYDLVTPCDCNILEITPQHENRAT